MRVSLITVGDELLAGDVENTNATWLARRLTERGTEVREIVVLPDEVDRVATEVRWHGERFNRVLVTGGLGSTPDDVTVEGIADGLGREVGRHERTNQLVTAAVEEIHEEYPDFEFDVERASLRPEGSEVIENEVGIAPGFVVENVYVLPGIPREMHPMFERVADEFEGAMHVRSLYSTQPESHLNEMLTRVAEKFDVSVGCYPGENNERKRITVRSTDRGDVDDAHEWLAARPETEPDRD